MSENKTDEKLYEDAKAALCAARDAFLLLKDADRKKVVKEVFGITDAFSVIRAIKDFLR